MKIILFSLIAVAIIGLMVPSVFAESTVQLYTDKKEYSMNDVIHVTGKVNFVNGKAVGIGLPDGLKVVIEVYDSSNRLSYTEIKDNVTGTFFFNIDTGFNTKLKNNDRYSFVAYYGLVNPELRNTNYTGNVHVYLGISAIEYNTILQTQVKENTPQNTSSGSPLPSWNWIAPVGIAIVILAVIVRIRQTIRGKSSGGSKYDQPKRPPIPGWVRHEVFKRDNYRCRECNNSPPDVVLHIDHIVPFSKGGADNLNNYQTLCAECNHAKHTRTWVGGEKKRRRFFR